MDTYSKELISNTYSGISYQKIEICDELEDYGMVSNVSNNGSVAEVSNVGPECSRKNISNATAQLSAQVMNLPYDEFCESVPYEASQISDTYNVLNRIKEAYAACTCKICKCLAGTTITPRAEFCDCEPCKCKECISLKDNLKLDSINFRSRFQNKSQDRLVYSQIKLNDTEICNCKPCDCIQCSKRCCYFDRKLREDNLNVVSNVSKKLFNPTVIHNCPLDKHFDIHRHPYTKCETFLNDACESNGPDYYRGTMKKSPNKSTAHVVIHNTTIKHKSPSYSSHSSQKCTCDLCECIVCECKKNDKSNGLLRYVDELQHLKQTNFKTCGCATCECQFCSRKKEVEHINCKGHVCDSIQCKKESVLNSRPKEQNKLKLHIPMFSKTNCLCKPCECNDCELTMSTHQGGCTCYTCRRKKSTGMYRNEISEPLSSSQVYDNILSKPISINQFRACSEITSAEKANAVVPDKFKHGNIVYVTNEGTYNLSAKYVSGPPQYTRMENNSSVNIPNYQRVGIANIINLAPIEIDASSRTLRSSSPTKSTNTVNGATMPVFTAINLRSFYPGSRSTQTITTSSSLLSCQSKGCSACTLSSPDTNSVVISTETNSCQFEKYEPLCRSQYGYIHDIPHCYGLKTDFNKLQTDGKPQFQTNNEVGKTRIASFLSDPFAQYLTKCNIDRSTESSYDSIRMTLQKAKELTRSMTTILQKYDRANSQFESMSTKLRKSHQEHVKGTRNSNVNHRDFESSLSVQDNKKGKIIIVERINLNNTVPVLESHDKNDSGGPFKVKYCKNPFTNIHMYQESCAYLLESMFRHKATSNNHLAISVEKKTDTLNIPQTNNLNNSELTKANNAEMTPTKTTELHDTNYCQTKSSNISNQAQRENMQEIENITGDEIHSIMKRVKYGVSNTTQTAKNSSIMIIEEQRAGDNKMDSLRASKIRDILNQNNMQTDLFTERVPSSRILSMMDAKDHYTFNYHTKTLLRSTESSF